MTIAKLLTDVRQKWFMGIRNQALGIRNQALGIRNQEEENLVVLNNILSFF